MADNQWAAQRNVSLPPVTEDAGADQLKDVIKSSPHQDKSNLQKWQPRKQNAREKARIARRKLAQATNVSSFAAAATAARASQLDDDDQSDTVVIQSLATRVRYFLITSWLGVGLGCGLVVVWFGLVWFARVQQSEAPCYHFMQ